MTNLEFDSIIFYEDNAYVASCPKLDVSSCGDTIEQARENLKIAVRLFLEEAEKLGTVDEILEEAGYTRSDNDEWMAPKLVQVESLRV